MVKLLLGQSIDAELMVIDRLRTCTITSLRARLVQFEIVMKKAFASLQMDVTLNVLTESTLSLPAVQRAIKGETSLVDAANDAVKPTKRTRNNNPNSGATSTDLLSAARDYLSKETYRQHPIPRYSAYP